MKIVCVGYRNWALNIYDKLKNDNDHEILIIRSKKDFSIKKIISFIPDIILFYGWSWKINIDLIENYTCIMLHPSPLPKYRGGTPIQNQIINGEKNSAVSLFIMDKGMDTGPILAQRNISFKGSLDEIFKRMTRIGLKLTKKILSEPLKPIKQNNKIATVYKRRLPKDSEFINNELNNNIPMDYIYNKIRMLDGEDYPNSFISCGEYKFEFSNANRTKNSIKAKVKIYKDIQIKKKK